MRTLMLSLVPMVFIGGLLYGTLKLHSLQRETALSCALGTCPLILQESDSGRTLTYKVSERLTAYFDRTKNSPANLKCAPEGVIGAVPGAPTLEEPMYAVILEALAAGNCTLINDNFSVTIVVE